VADTRYLKQRRQGWYFQLAVPRALRKALGKATITTSLRTRDLGLAQDRRWAELVRVREGFAKLAGGKAPATETLAPDALVRIDDAARVYYRYLLQLMAAEARSGVCAWGAPELERAWHEAMTAYVADSDFRSVAKPLAAYCEAHAIEPGNLHYYVAGDALLSARMRAIEGRRAALDGKPTLDEPATFLMKRPIDPVGRGGLIFMEVAQRCLREKQRDVAVRLTKQTEEQYRVAHRLFDQFAGQPTLDAVDRRLASQFLDAIAGLDPRWGRGKDVKSLTFAEIVAKFGGHKRGLANRTLNKYVTALGIVWDYASKRDGFNGANPWEGQLRPTTARRGNAETGKRGFSPPELRTLLAVAPNPKPVVHDIASTLPWLALIGAFSGMRLNETTGLDVEDVKRTADIWYFDLTQAKSEAGVRVVPIHSQLVDAGFLDYIEHVGKGSLWPGLRPGGLDGKRGIYASKRFTVFRRALKLVDIDPSTGRDRLDYHSLRRSAVTALKRAGIPEADISELVGHEHPHITLGRYADRHQLERLKAIVEAIQYNC
jgi:integrase